MSRKRKLIRETLQRGEKMVLDLRVEFEKKVELALRDGATKEVEKVHEFQIHTYQGVGVLRVPHGKMKRCFCGSDRFAKEYYVGWGKPANVLGGQPMCVEVPVYACVACGKAFTMQNPMVETPQLEG